MKKVTISLPDDLARWLRVRAAADGRSVSEWIADLLAETKRRDDEYEAARKQALAIKPWKMEWVDGRKPTREELHDRTGFRDAPTPSPTGSTPEISGSSPALSTGSRYDVAMKRYLAMKPRRIDWPDGRRPTREELYDRPRFR